MARRHLLLPHAGKLLVKRRRGHTAKARCAQGLGDEGQRDGAGGRLCPSAWADAGLQAARPACLPWERERASGRRRSSRSWRRQAEPSSQASAWELSGPDSHSWAIISKGLRIRAPHGAGRFLNQAELLSDARCYSLVTEASTCRRLAQCPRGRWSLRRLP